MSDDGSYDKKKQNRHFISTKMSHFITLIALLLCRRSPYTLRLVRGWVGCAFLDCLGKCHRRQKEKERGVDTDLPFTLMHIAWLTHLQRGVCECGCAHVCVPWGVWSCTFLCAPIVHLCVCVCEHLTWFVAQCVSNFLWDAIFNHLKHLPWAYTVDMLHLTHTASYLFHFQSGVCNASLVGTHNRTKINGRVTKSQ